LNNYKETLINPFAIKQTSDDLNLFLYYHHYKESFNNARYLLVVVRYLNGEGFVITIFATNKIKDQT